MLAKTATLSVNAMIRLSVIYRPTGHSTSVVFGAVSHRRTVR